MTSTEFSTGAPTEAADRQVVVDTIVRALAEVTKRELPDVGEHTLLFQEIGLDSTTVLELVIQIEGMLDVEFDSDTLEQHHFESVGSLADYVLVQSAG